MTMMMNVCCVSRRLQSQRRLLVSKWSGRSCDVSRARFSLSCCNTTIVNNNNDNDVAKRVVAAWLPKDESWKQQTFPVGIHSNNNNNKNQYYHQLSRRHALSTVSVAASEDDNNEETTTTTSNDLYKTSSRKGVRNVAIVAHVDHGKTTLVDQLLKIASTRQNNNDEMETTERLLDSGDLEKERGITIKSKVTRLSYQHQQQNDDDDYIINVVDTPGHADFAGEVDRVLSLVNGICLLVDVSEGPMAQTKYVLSRALSLGLPAIVVFNKMDRAGADRIDQSEGQVLDLFDSLGASEEQMEYTTLYASARDGWMTDDLDVAMNLSQQQGQENEKDNDDETNMKVLLNAILQHIPEPTIRKYNCHDNEDTEKYFSLAATTVGNDPYLGRTCTGRIYSGSVTLNDSVIVLKRNNDDDESTTSLSPTITSEATKLTGLFVNRGVSREPLDESVARAGDIVTLAGIPDSIAVGDTITSATHPIPVPLETPPLAPPTLSMDFGTNTGPLAGQIPGSICTSSRVQARLVAETDNNITLTVKKCETDAEKMTVYARGELQLGILIEEMRREGYELLISPPKILTTIDDNGIEMEPFEEVTVDVDSEYAGTVVNALTGLDRRGILLEMQDNPSDGKTRLILQVPSRGLLGFGPEVATMTRGTAVVNHCFLEDREHVGTMGDGLSNGKLVSNEHGKASNYALTSISERGTLFIEPGDLVYPGMVIGEYNRGGADLEVNPVRAKQVTNMRTVKKDERTYLAPPKKMTVEELIGYMDEDEIIEVTPDSVRLRKAELDPGVRERMARTKRKQQKALKEQRK